MEDIKKDLVPYIMDQEEHFTAQTPMIFENEFTKNTTEHWEQVKALRKMHDSPSMSGSEWYLFSHSYQCWNCSRLIDQGCFTIGR